MTDLATHARSAAVRNPKLGIFSVPSTDLSITATREVKVNPLTTGINPINFQVEQSTDFLDLDRSFFEIELRIKKTDGGNLVAGDVLVLANNLAHTLFRQISVKFNGTLLSPQTDTYHHLAFIETLLNNDKDDGKDLLVPQGWYNGLDLVDDGGVTEFTAHRLDTTHDDFKALSEDRQNIVLSRVKFLGGNRIVLRFTPALEVFRLGKLLIPGVQIQIEMYLNNPNLWTVRHDGATLLRLEEGDISCRLYLKQCKVQPSVYKELVDQLHKGKKAAYPTVRGAIRTYSHQNDNRHFECDNPFNGEVPNRVIVVLMKQTAFNGAATDNPFGYGKFNLSTIKLIIAGEEYPYETLQLNHNNNHADHRGYHRFLEATGCFTRGRGNLVGPDNWGHGKLANLFVFDTTANGSLDSPVLNPKATGNLRVVIDFGANPGENLTVLLYGEFENMLEIAGNGTVVYDVYQ